MNPAKSHVAGRVAADAFVSVPSDAHGVRVLLLDGAPCEPLQQRCLKVESLAIASNIRIDRLSSKRLQNMRDRVARVAFEIGCRVRGERVAGVVPVAGEARRFLADEGGATRRVRPDTERGAQAIPERKKTVERAICVQALAVVGDRYPQVPPRPKGDCTWWFDRHQAGVRSARTNNCGVVRVRLAAAAYAHDLCRPVPPEGDRERNRWRQSANARSSSSASITTVTLGPDSS